MFAKFMLFATLFFVLRFVIRNAGRKKNYIYSRISELPHDLGNEAEELWLLQLLQHLHLGIAEGMLSVRLPQVVVRLEYRKEEVGRHSEEQLIEV